MSWAVLVVLLLSLAAFPDDDGALTSVAFFDALTWRVKDDVKNVAAGVCMVFAWDGKLGVCDGKTEPETASNLNNFADDLTRTVLLIELRIKR